MSSAVASAVDRARALQDLVREHADVSEQQRHLAAPVAQAFAEQGLYRIAATEDCHGSADDPMTQVETIEAIAYADGSAAWNLMIGIESFGLITPGFKDCMELVADPSVVMCSSTAAVGRADRINGGYRISGRWQFVSGCHNSQLFGATVRIWEDGEMVEDLPNFYAMIEAPHFQIVDTWHTSGLCGSGSHDVQVDDVEIPESRLVLPLGAAEHDSPLLNFPLGARLAYNKVGVAWGMTRAAIDAFVELAEGKMPRFSRRGLKDRPRAHRTVAEAEVCLRAGRAFVMDELRKMWAQVQAGEHITTHERAVFQLACSDSVRACIEAVGMLCEASGTSANQKGFALERIMRDIRVVGQHLTVAPHHIEDAGRVFLGLPAQEMMLAGNISR
jgi:alkylation response protein AidB-like acyl-CoA dehydrogenase